MKRFTSFGVIVLSVLFASTGCRMIGKGIKGSGTIKTEKRELGAFTSVETTGAYEIQITCQQRQSLEIEGDDNILPIIRTEVRDGVLHISNEQNYQDMHAWMLSKMEKFSSVLPRASSRFRSLRCRTFATTMTYRKSEPKAGRYE